MKFKKEEAGKELIRKMTLNGETINTSERSINEALDIFIPKFATEETSLDDFVAEILPLMTINENNMRNDNSNFAKSFGEKKNAEIEELRAKLEKLTTEGNTKPNTGDSKSSKSNEGDSKLDAILNEINILKKQREEDDAKMIITNKKEILIDTLKTKGLKSEKAINSYLSVIDLTKDTDVDAVSTRILDAFNQMKASQGGENPPNTGKGGKELDTTTQFYKLKEFVK